MKLDRREMLQRAATLLPLIGAPGLLGCGGSPAGPVDAAVDGDLDAAVDAALPGDADADGDVGLDADGEQDAEGEVCDTTLHDALGPFYEEGSPERTAIAEEGEPGDRVTITGTVSSADCSTPLEGALIEIWHADADGVYHPGSEGFRLRGQFSSGTAGEYAFSSIRPGHYSGRPRHFHYQVSAPGHVTLVTQLYFVGDPLLHPNDSCGEGVCNSNDPQRIIALEDEGDEGLSGRFDVILARL